ncbi:MAG: hypothetical protein AAFV78_17405 [Bacteroidota bacterium]
MLHTHTFKTFLLLALVMVSAVFLGACRKYPDGPSISFIPKETRVSQTWQATSISRNTIQEVTIYENFNFNFNSNGSVAWTTQLAGEDPVVRNAQWELASVNEELKLTFDAANSPSGEERLLFMEIRRLTNNEMWLAYFWEGDEWDVRFEAN